MAKSTKNYLVITALVLTLSFGFILKAPKANAYDSYDDYGIFDYSSLEDGMIGSSWDGQEDDWHGDEEEWYGEDYGDEYGYNPIDEYDDSYWGYEDYGDEEEWYGEDYGDEYGYNPIDEYDDSYWGYDEYGYDYGDDYGDDTMCFSNGWCDAEYNRNYDDYESQCYGCGDDIYTYDEEDNFYPVDHEDHFIPVDEEEDNNIAVISNNINNNSNKNDNKNENNISISNDNGNSQSQSISLKIK